jgi:fluoride ion exporter CrcB/FEX
MKSPVLGSGNGLTPWAFGSDRDTGSYGALGTFSRYELGTVSFIRDGDLLLRGRNE